MSSLLLWEEGSWGFSIGEDGMAAPTLCVTRVGWKAESLAGGQQGGFLSGNGCRAGQGLWGEGLSSKTLHRFSERPGYERQRLFQEWMRDLSDT